MIKINLLPFRAARTKENIRRQVSIYFLSLVMVTALLVYYNIKLSGQVNTLTSEVENITAEVVSFEEKADKVDAIKAKLAILQKKNNVIETLEMNRYEPVKLLDYMTKAVVVDRMWFTKLSEKEKVTVVNKKKSKKKKKSNVECAS